MDIPAHTARAQNCSFINGVTCYTAHLCTSLDSGRGRVHVHTFAICCSCCVHARRNIHGCASKVCLLSRRQRCISACINACVIVRACPCVVCMHGCSPVCRLLARIRCHMASAQKTRDEGNDRIAHPRDRSSLSHLHVRNAAALGAA